MAARLSTTTSDHGLVVGGLDAQNRQDWLFDLRRDG